MAKYTYEGNRDGNSLVSAIIYEDQGTVYEDGQPPEIRIGDTIDLSAAERDRLSPLFVLTDKSGNDVGEGQTPPTATPLDAASTSPSEGTIQESSSPSASSKKS